MREGKATERVKESEMKTGREERETKPRDPAEAPKTEEEKEWEAAAHPPFPSILFANCASAGRLSSSLIFVG